VSQTLATRAGRALGWNLANTLASRLGTFAIGVALARIVGPEEFGTFAVALVTLLAVLSFNELGVSLAIVRWEGDPREIAPTVASIATLSSVAIFVASLVAAPWLCAAMGAPEATDVVRLLSVSILISGLVATPAALLQRDFRAGRRMAIDQVGNWSGALVSIATAIGGMGAMSLAVGRLTGAVLTGVLFLCSAPVRFGFDRSIARRLLAFGLPLAGSSIVVFAVTYADQFVVAGVLGPIALGFYVMAFNLSNWPVAVFSQPVRQVSPATFARLQGDPPALRRSFVLSTGLLAAITLPVCLVLTGAAVPLVDFLYGSAWAPAADALVWLGVLAGLRILFELVYDYFVVLARTRLVLAVHAAWLVALVPAVYVGAKLGGLGGASAGMVAVALAVVLPIYLVTLRRMGIATRRLGDAIALPLASAAAVGILAYAAQLLLAPDLLALGAALLALLAALAWQARSVRGALARLRSAVDGGGDDRRQAAVARRAPVSIVCVANDAVVRERCLDRSIADHLDEAPDTEYLPIDNRGGQFASAGAALNHGARQARHDVVVFVHQDVYLHSLKALELAAGMLAERPEIGMHGAVGITAAGRIVGRVRDRIVLIGEPTDAPTDVDSLDEVLFMVPRATLLEEPLAETPDLAWHAYAVEYGLRMRALEKRVTAGDIPLTHNSLTVNLARLDAAHRAVAARHPEALPVRTTCGTVSDSAAPPAEPPGRLSSQRWRYRWLKGSVVAHRIRRAVGAGPVVLSDPRHDVDDAIAGLGGRLEVVNLDRGLADAGAERGRVDLMRRDREVSVTAMAFAEVEREVARWQPQRTLLVTNLTVADLRRLADRLPAGAPRLAGYHDQTGGWLLLGEPARHAPRPWTSRRCTPLGMAPLHAAVS
jgi:O-antigen/teichoic acid export membrane protein